MIQKIRAEGDNIHIGRFLINPSLTGKGLGTSAMRLFISMLFEKEGVHSISLNVFDDNPAAKSIYEKIDFKTIETIEGERKKYMMMRNALLEN